MSHGSLGVHVHRTLISDMLFPSQRSADGQASAKLPDEMMESEWKSRYERLEERMKAAPQRFLVDFPQNA